MKKPWFFILWLLALQACEKDITIDLNDAEPVLVVDAQIENGQAPLVYLTKSTSFFSQVDATVLAGLFVRNAEVTMSNGTLTHRLKEYSVPFSPGFNLYYYSIDSSSLATAFEGAIGGHYTLQITAEGKTYTAETNIPDIAIRPDSFYFRQAPFNPDSNKRVMFVRASDPPGLGNYARYFTKVNSAPFYPGENSVFSDQVVDGTSFEGQLPPGIDRNNPPPDDDNIFNRGDTVTLKFCNIDRATYQFWSTWEFAYQSIGNPFAQPNTVKSNISNGALGAFCGYACWYDTVIAP